MEGNVFRIHAAEGDITSLPENRTYTVCFKKGMTGAEVFINGEKAVAQIDGNTVTIDRIKPADKVEIVIG